MSSLRTVLADHWAWDPRGGDAVQSNNPALILGMLLVAQGADVGWRSVADRADFCDEPVTPAEGFG
jgi:hypothetical protein